MTRPYGGAAYGGGVGQPGADGGAVIVDPSRPDLPGYQWLTSGGGAPYGALPYGGGGAQARPVAGGLAIVPDSGTGVVRIDAWWVGAEFLQLVRITDGVPTPVRLAFPARVLTATRRNMATNPSVETDAAGYLAGSNTTITRQTTGDTLAGTAFLRLKATASGQVSVTVPVLLPTDTTFGTSFNARYSATPSGTLTVTAAWQDSTGAALTPTTGTIASGSLTPYVGRWQRTGVFTMTPTVGAIPGPNGGFLANPAVQGTLTFSFAGLAANATVDLDAVLVEPGANTAGTYFDGDDTYGAWTGTADNSASALAAPIAVVDGEAPLDTPFLYELRSPSAPGYVIRSEPVTLDSTAPGSMRRRTWLSHPAQPGAPIPCKVTEAPELTRSARRGLFDVIGRAEPIAVATSVRSAPTGTVTVLTESVLERDRLLSALADNSVLLLRAPAEYGYGPGWWISVGDAVERAQNHYAGPTTSGEFVRLTELPFTVVSAPSEAVV